VSRVIKFLLTRRLLGTFAIFIRLFRDIEIRNQGATEENGNKALAAKQTQSRDAPQF
jgi:hypothetical protein